MSHLNIVHLIGNLAADPVLRQTTSGKAVVNFAIGTGTKVGDPKAVEWHNIVAFEKMAENCAQYVKKGKLVYVQGRLQTRKYDKNGVTHYMTEVIASNIQFLSRPDSEPKPLPTEVPKAEAEYLPTLDEIPFF